MLQNTFRMYLRRPSSPMPCFACRVLRDYSLGEPRVIVAGDLEVSFGDWLGGVSRA